MKKTLAWILALALLTSAAFAEGRELSECFGKDIKSAAEELKKGDQPVATSTKDEKEDAKKDEAKKEDVKKEEPKPDYSNMKAGETVTLENGLDITVNSFSRATRSYSDDELVCANVTYKNNGNHVKTFTLTLPVKVSYGFGIIDTNVDVEVAETIGTKAPRK